MSWLERLRTLEKQKHTKHELIKLTEPSFVSSVSSENARKCFFESAEQPDVSSLDTAKPTDVFAVTQSTATDRIPFVSFVSSVTAHKNLLDDDRVYCRACVNWIAGRCQAVKRGVLVGPLRPNPDQLQRCDRYTPHPQAISPTTPK